MSSRENFLRSYVETICASFSKTMIATTMRLIHCLFLDHDSAVYLRVVFCRIFLQMIGSQIRLRLIQRNHLEVEAVMTF